MTNTSVAIIGAGLSSAICAKSLHGLVDKVSVFEQGQHVGGRLWFNDAVSTTPFFSVSTTFFKTILESWQSAGWIQPRELSGVEILGREIIPVDFDVSDSIVKPNTTQLLNHLLEGTSVALNTEVYEIEQKGKQWRLFDVLGNYLGIFDCVIFSSAAYPLHRLLKISDMLYLKVKNINYSKVWSVVLEFSEPIDFPYDNGVFIESILSNFHCVSDGNSHFVYLEATPEWSELNVHVTEENVCQELKSVFFQHLGLASEGVMSTQAKFWPNKAAINSLNEDCLFDKSLGLGACGDWCTSARVEGAVLSGFSVADRVMKYLS